MIITSQNKSLLAISPKIIYMKEMHLWDEGIIYEIVCRENENKIILGSYSEKDNAVSVLRIIALSIELNRKSFEMLEDSKYAIITELEKLENEKRGKNY